MPSAVSRGFTQIKSQVQNLSTSTQTCDRIIFQFCSAEPQAEIELKQDEYTVSRNPVSATGVGVGLSNGQSHQLTAAVS